MEYILLFISFGVLFALVDFFWLTLVANKLYRSEVGHLLAKKPDLVPAVLFYLIYVAGVVFFALQPALEQGQWSVALVNAAALGFVAYATYELTNASTLKGWTWKLTLSDLAWGTFATSVASVGAYFIVGAIL